MIVEDLNGFLADLRALQKDVRDFARVSAKSEYTDTGEVWILLERLMAVHVPARVKTKTAEVIVP